MTKMIQAKIDYDCREYLIGHKRSRGLNVHYDRTSETERFIEWAKSINLLTIDPTQRLQKQVEKLESERSDELKQLKAQLIEFKKFAEKTAAEINDLKANKGLERYENAKNFVDPNFSNIVKAINELRVKNGQEPVAIITPQEAAEEAERIRFQTRYIRETKECPPLGLTNDYK